MPMTRQLEERTEGSDNTDFMPQDQEVEQDGNMSRLISYRVVPGTNRADHHAFSVTFTR